MKKQELIENISKVEQLLNSDTPEAGFELLKTINKSELNEALSDLIQSIVKEKYFTPYGRRPANYSEGLDLLRKLIPNLTSLDLSGTDIDELDLDKFINLQELNISYCGELHTVIGLEKLNKLTSLNCISTDSLLNLDVNKLKLLPNIIGLRDKNGICFGGNIQAREHTWWGYLDDFIDNYFDYEGGITILVIDESDFHDERFNFRIAGPEFISSHNRKNISKELSESSLEPWFNKEQIKSLFSSNSFLWPSDVEVSVALFTSGWTFITSFLKHQENFYIECDECYGEFTLDETVPIDEFDESVRCCSDCSEQNA